MGDNIIKCCRSDFPKDEYKTSTQIALPYIPARTVLNEKMPLPRVPTVKMGKSYETGRVYMPQDGLKTTYNEFFVMPMPESCINYASLKLINPQREYSTLGRQNMPVHFGSTEYQDEYPTKDLPQCVKGVSVEMQTSCPMVTTGRDERDPLPLTENYGKYLDIYLSTTRLAHRAFTMEEQKTIAMKDVVTMQETMGVPKARPFGCKFPAFAGQDLDNRDKNMVDKAFFHVEAKSRFIPKGMPKVPNFGSESEMQSAYVKPKGHAVSHLFDGFVDFFPTIPPPKAKQTLCAPGMYTTESYAIDHHTSPQTVV